MSEHPFPGYETASLTDYEELKKRENNLLEKLLAILFVLLHDGMPTEKAYEIGAGFISEEFNAVIKDTNRIAAEQGLPIIPQERVQSILSQALIDFKNELSDLEFEKQGKVPEKGSVISRIGLTSWFVVWATHQNMITQIAEKANVIEVLWRNMEDGSVCSICIANTGIHRLEDLPEYPPHPLCRCWIEVVMPSPRERLDMMFTVAQRLRSR